MCPTTSAPPWTCKDMRNFKSPWGNSLPLFHSANLNLINLETAVTTCAKPWPGKTFSYRMHPANLQCLGEAHIDYVSLANNHTLDYGEEGLLETVKKLKESNIPFAGAGVSPEGAQQPAVLGLKDEGENYSVHVYSCADHPAEWFNVPNLHSIDYSSATRERLKQLLMSNAIKPDLKIFSVHWGPNYSWAPSDDIRSLAHFLVDECAVDIVHGHSSHHVQGVEVYKGKLIIYGCGDFVDDYALHAEYRNDLSAVWRVGVEASDIPDGPRLRVTQLEIFPSRINRFQANLIGKNDPDHYWLKETLHPLCEDLNTEVQEELGKDDQIIVKVV